MYSINATKGSGKHVKENENGKVKLRLVFYKWCKLCVMRYKNIRSVCVREIMLSTCYYVRPEPQVR